MNFLKSLDKLIYGLSLKAAKGTRNHYHKKSVKDYNRELADIFAYGWDEAERVHQYMDVVRPYWKKFGRKPDMFWFELAGSRDHKMDPRYIPSDLYYLELLPYLNNRPFHDALEDKNYLDLRFPDVKQAKTVCRRIAGEYYNPGMELINIDDALKLCKDHKDPLYIKPSLYSSFGNDIIEFTPSELSDDELKQLFFDEGANFIVQEKIKQHAALSALNPDSVCTIRALSLFVDGKVHITNMYLRVSVPGESHVSPGYEYNAEIRPDGTVSKMICLDEGGWLDNDKDEVFGGEVTINVVGRIIEEVEKMHPKVGHFKWIGWDFTIDEAGDLIFIELDSSPSEHAQRVCGNPLFGDMTDWVLKDYFESRSMEDYQLGGSLCMNEDIERLNG